MKELMRMETIEFQKRIANPVNYNLNLFLYVFGRFVSGLGGSVFNFAMGLYVLDLTGSASAFSMILIFSVLPGFVINIFGGVFVDRNDKKMIIVASDVISGLGVLLFMVLFGFYSSSLALFIVFAVIIGSIQSFFVLAINAAIPNLVSEEKVAKANSASQIVWSAMNIVGPVLGAIAYKTLGMYRIFLIYGLFLLIAGLAEAFLKFIPSSTIDTEADGTNYLQGIKEAARYIINQKILIFFFIFIAVMNFVYTPVMSLLLPYVNYNVIKISGLQLSIVQAAGAVGVILGAILVSVGKSVNALLKKFFIFFEVQAILIILWFFARLPLFQGLYKWPIVIIFSVLLVTICLINTIQNIPMITYFQVKIPENMRARVLGVFTTSVYISSPIGLFVFGFALDRVNWVFVTSVAGILMLLTGIVFSRNIHFRTFVKELDTK